jgi:hypothetical protein
MSVAETAAPIQVEPPLAGTVRTSLRIWDELTLNARIAWLMFMHSTTNTRLYLRATWWMWLLRVVLKALSVAGMASSAILLLPVLSIIEVFHVTTSNPFVLMALTTNPLVLADAAHGMSPAIFFLIAVPRLMLADPLNYLLGQRSLPFVQDRKRKPRKWRLTRWFVGKFDKYTERLAHASGRKLYANVFILTLIPLPGGWLGPNVYHFAGASRAKLGRVMKVDLAATLVFAAAVFTFGHFIDLIGLLRHMIAFTEALF